MVLGSVLNGLVCIRAVFIIACFIIVYYCVGLISFLIAIRVKKSCYLIIYFNFKCGTN